MYCSDVLATSGVKFGTSGARGLVEDFTEEVCAAFTVAFVEVMRENFQFDTLILAIDNRPSSPRMAEFCAAAAKACGLHVIYYGVIPTPALAYQSMIDGVPAIMITGSHIPFDRNGLKFYSPVGEITKEHETRIATSKALLKGLGHVLTLECSDKAAQNYKQRYVDIFPSNCLAGKRIGIYEHSSAGRELYKDIFEQLGAEVLSLGRTDTFVPIDTEAVADEDKLRGIEWSTEHKLDVIFSTDGDGDRPLIADESGQWLRGDIVGLLCAKYLKVPALAIPVSCNTAVEKSGFFDKVVRTKIGSPFVIAEFESLKANFSVVAGFEANGGFLLGSDLVFEGAPLKSLPTRDALLPALILFYSSARLGCPLSSLVGELPRCFTYSDRVTEYPAQRSLELKQRISASPSEFIRKFLPQSQVESVDFTDGIRMTLSNSDVLHLRPSGNAPELRCYAESVSEQSAEQMVRIALGYIRSEVTSL